MRGCQRKDKWLILDKDMKIEEVIALKKQSALKGRELWISIKNDFEVDDESYLVILPTDEKKLNESTINNLTYFITRKYIKKIVLVVKDNIADQRMRKIAEVVPCVITNKNMDDLISYCRLQQFFRNTVVVSMDEPFGTRGIVGKQGITLDDYVRDAIFV